MTAVSQFKPNEVFVKTWRVQNSGTCTWNPDYRLMYAYGNSDLPQMGGQPVNVTITVAPGQTYDVSVNLTAPAVPGTYQGMWQMTDARGVSFGEEIYAAAAVPGVPNPHPALPPLPCRVPSLLLTAPTSARVSA